MDKHCPKDRKNFLSYSYCIYKFFELLGYEQLLVKFTKPNGAETMCIFGTADSLMYNLCDNRNGCLHQLGKDYPQAWTYKVARSKGSLSLRRTTTSLKKEDPRHH